jgi:L-threonylcarbamoyladenylate synthase
MTKHYSPRARLILCEKKIQYCDNNINAAFLLIGGDHDERDFFYLPNNPAHYEKNLYAKLHYIDKSGVDIVFVEVPPATEEWRAVRDRLLRAASRQGERGA